MVGKRTGGGEGKENGQEKDEKRGQEAYRYD